MTAATVGGAQTLDLLRSLGACGLDCEAICRDAGLDPRLLTTDDARVPGRIVAAVLSAAERSSGDAIVGLHAAEHSTPRGPLLYLMLASANLEAGIRYWEQFGQIPVSSLRVRVEKTASTAAMTFDFDDADLDEGPHVAEYLLLAVLRPLRQAVAGDLRPREVSFRHALRGDASDFRRAFGCPVRFGQPHHALVFHRRDLGMPSRLANPEVAEQIASLTAALDRRGSLRGTWRERVAEVTRALLVTGQRADRASAARQLHTSEPSLHRALRDEHTTFKAVRDAEVWSVARALLSNPTIKLEAVARTVGFADHPSFAKAFKRHSGLSPGAYRERVATSAPPSS